MPTSKEFIEMDLKYCAHNYHPIPVVISRAEAVQVYDQKGNFGTKFNRIQITEISEVSSIPNHESIKSIVKEMIDTNQIFAQYFSSTNSVAFDQNSNNNEIDKFLASYKE